MKRPLPPPALIALAVGVILIGFGLFRGAGDLSGGLGATDGESSPDPAPGGLDDDLGMALDLGGEREVIPGSRAAANEPKKETLLLARVTLAPDGQVAVGARVSLWRVQTGEGPSFRPARRLTQLTTDDEGSVQFTAPSDSSLEVYAQTQDGGPIARLDIQPLSRGESRTVRMTVERPPAPLSFSVLDAQTGAAISGASIRTVPTGPENRPISDFPGSTQLAQRTNADGEALLPGPVRNAHWLLIDAAGYSPKAVDPRSLDGVGAAEIALEHAAKLSVQVTLESGTPAADYEVSLLVRIDGYATTFTAMTNRRGEASFRRVPSGCALVPRVSLGDDVAVPFDAITLAPLEQGTLALQLED